MVELSIPAQQEMLLVLRMALSGVCAKRGMGMDALDSIRIAADEACYCLMHQIQPVERLRMRCEWTPTQLVVLLTVDRSEDAPRDMEAHDPELSRCILASVVPQVELTHDALGVYGIRMTLCPKAV